jgi:hypothetical protein
VALLAFAGVRAGAASIESLQTSRAGGGYAVELHARLEVPVAAAYAAFADVTNWTRISPNLRRLDVVKQHRDGAMELVTTFEACVLRLCGHVQAVPDVFPERRAGGSDILIILRPNKGDFRAGRARLSFRGSGSATELEISAQVEPAFAVPAVIGPWVMAHWLRHGAVATSIHIEALARSSAGAHTEPLDLCAGSEGAPGCTGPSRPRLLPGARPQAPVAAAR